ncbi:hypothetical protein F2Q69_00019437 [Brassica cretica]|uniref:Uncharacterized protein n=1 Tax=Brassica cretica TaxID=69181 RepID=A0A8S9QDH7_BRACR|nr:hypothetical protein F2Q69_00019437 [Brassica cretica]
MSSSNYFRSWIDRPHLDPNTRLLTEEYQRGITEFMGLVHRQPEAKTDAGKAPERVLFSPYASIHLSGPMTPPLSLFPDPRLLLSFALSLLSYALHTVGETSSACRRVLRSLNVEFSGTHFRIAQVSSFSNLASNECPSLNLEDGL